MTFWLFRFAALPVLVALAACGSAAPSTFLSPTWPVIGEVLPAATDATPSEFGPATWALDPAYPAPDAATTELHVLVWERACSSGKATTGRMSAPVIVSTADTMTISISVRPPPGDAQTCPLPPGTPAVIRLSEPLGSRTLLDGGRVPPGPPATP